MVGPERRQYIERVMIFIGIATLVVLTILLVINTVWIWLLVFASILFTVALRAPAEWLSDHTPLSDLWALAVVGVVVLAVVVAAGWFLGPRIVNQFQQLGDQLPNTWEGLRDQLRQTQWGQFLLNATPGLTDQEGSLLQAARGLLGQLQSLISAIVAFVTFFTVMVFNGAYMAMTRDEHVEGTVKLVPKRHQERAHQVLIEIRSYLQEWLLSRLVAMLYLGVVSGLGLWLIGVPLPFALGLLSGLFAFIPNFGPLFAGVPALLIALALPGTGPNTALWVIALYLGAQLVLQYVLVPLLLRGMVQLPVIPTITFQLIMSVLVGPVGLILAAPLFAVIYVLVQMLYMRDVLGEEVDMQPPFEDGETATAAAD